MMASITINGNTIEPQGTVGQAWTLTSGTSSDVALPAAPDASKSNFIIVQVTDIPDVDEKQVLLDNHVQILEYVAENTYLCRYEPSDLGSLRSLPFVDRVDIYHPELKTTISLKDMVERHADQTDYTVDLILHDVPNVSPAQLAAYVERDSGVPVADQEILSRKIRLTVHQDKLAALAALDSVNRIEEVRSYDAYNDQARAVLLDSDTIKARSISPQCQGTGQKICVADSGFDQGVIVDTADIKVHPALLGRVENVMTMVPNVSPQDPTGHGTHVCASICGDGIYKNTTDSTDVPMKGTAPAAKLVVQAMSRWSDTGRKWILQPPAEMTMLFSSAYDMGIKIHTNSWGKKISTTNGQLGYEGDATEFDRFAQENLDFCILVAAGNDAEKNNTWKSQIGASAAAKNCITVGATGTTRDNDGQRYARGFKNGYNISKTAIFSSRGPTLSTLDAKGQVLVGRIKPDVVAPGVAILSAASRALARDSRDRVMCGPSDDPDWMFASGTSMATPLVAGCIALLREELQAMGKQRPTAALIKALLINGAVHDGVGKPVFDYEQGFGRVNVYASIAMIKTACFVDGCGSKLENTAQDVACLRVTPEEAKTWQSPALAVPSGRNRLAVTLTYPDPHGALLQNDVNLIVRAGGVERHGNMIEGDQGFDTTNNVEKIVWEDIPDTSVTIVVRAEAFALTSKEQTFAVAWDIRSV